MSEDVVIRPYRDQDEHGWVVCRVLSFLDWRHGLPDTNICSILGGCAPTTGSSPASRR